MTSLPFNRLHNFSAGPAALPLEVLQQAQADLLNWQGAGMSVLEMSHRGKAFSRIIAEAEADLRALLNIPGDYAVLFLQGGATQQFSMAPANLRPAGASADYVITGYWSKAALKEAQKSGAVRVAASAESVNFDRLPTEFHFDDKAAYVHLTSNETIQGVEWPADSEPTPPAGVPLVCDMSSDFLSRPVDVTRYGLIYAGAQKNAGPAGVTIVILRKDLTVRTPPNLPLVFDYKVQVDNQSLYNTPPAFSIYMVGLVFKWLLGIGGLAEMARRNAAKAARVYAVIDQSGGFYTGHAQPGARSLMNITFRLPTPELDEAFVKEAAQHGLDGLKGHRAVGGLRASTYNYLPLESVEALTAFMRDFQRTHG